MIGYRFNDLNNCLFSNITFYFKGYTGLLGPKGEPGIPGYRVSNSSWRWESIYLDENIYIKMLSQICKLRSNIPDEPF